MCCAPSSLSWAPTGSRDALSSPGEGPVQHVRDERALAAARDAGDGRECPERQAQVDVPEVVLAGPANDQLLAVALAPLLGDRYLQLAPKVRPGDRARLGHTALERPVRDDLPAVLPGSGPDVDDPVGGPDRLLVVLDDQDRVAEVAEPCQRRDQLALSRWCSPIDGSSRM